MRRNYGNRRRARRYEIKCALFSIIEEIASSFFFFIIAPVQRAPRVRSTREVYFTEIDTGISVPRRGGDETERYNG